jgi:hypothetical protein
MSEGVFITKNGIRVMEWNGDLKEYVEKTDTNYFHELRTTCHVEPDVTLKDVINYVYKNDALKVLIEEYSWCDVDAFYKEVNIPAVKESTIEFIELMRCIEFDQWGVTDGVHVSGCGPHEPEEYDDRTYINNWAIELTPTNELANARIRLNPKVIFSDSRAADYKDHKREEIDGASFSFLDVLGEIFFEISFCGSPSSREERNQILKTAVDELKSGKAKTVPFKFEDETIQ